MQCEGLSARSLPCPLSLPCRPRAPAQEGRRSEPGQVGRPSGALCPLVSPQHGDHSQSLGAAGARSPCSVVSNHFWLPRVLCGFGAGWRSAGQEEKVSTPRPASSVPTTLRLSGGRDAARLSGRWGPGPA